MKKHLLTGLILAAGLTAIFFTSCEESSNIETVDVKMMDSTGGGGEIVLEPGSTTFYLEGIKEEISVLPDCPQDDPICNLTFIYEPGDSTSGGGERSIVLGKVSIVKEKLKKKIRFRFSH